MIRLPKSPAARLQMAMDLYAQGILCKCNQISEHEDEETGAKYEILTHDKDCIGRDKVMELLNYE